MHCLRSVAKRAARTVTARSPAAAFPHPRTLQRRVLMAAANESGSAAGSSHPPSACVIFLHGSGGCGEEWAEAMAGVQNLLPWVEFIFPTARARPYTLFGGEIANVWFDRNELGLACREDRQGIAASVQRVEQILADGPVKQRGIGRDRTVVAGFSQGGGLALYTAYGEQNQTPFAACLTSGAFLPDPSMLVPPVTTTATAAESADAVADAAAPPSSGIPARLLSTPLLMVHGTADGVVPWRNSLSTFERLQKRALLPHATYVTRKGMQHEIDDLALQHILTFIRKVLPPL